MTRDLTLLLALLALPSCQKEPTVTWGFVATLGNDTTSVERVTRRGNHIEGEAIGRSAFAVRLGVSFPRLNEIIHAKRAVTPDTALRLAQVTGMSADFWLGLQQDWDLWHALRTQAAVEIARLEPLSKVGQDGGTRAFHATEVAARPMSPAATRYRMIRPVLRFGHARYRPKGDSCRAATLVASDAPARGVTRPARPAYPPDVHRSFPRSASGSFLSGSATTLVTRPWLAT